VPKSKDYLWQFMPRFRRHAFGWRSQAAIFRIKQAVAEIKKVARKDPVLAAEGAVLFLERVSPAIEQVDGSSGAIGTAVNNAVEELVAIISAAPAGRKERDAWLQRLWAAYEADKMPYIERLGDHWGELCAFREVASAWADELLSTTRMALSPDKNLRGHFHGACACLSALYFAQRYEEILDVLKHEKMWTYRRWAVKALVAMERLEEAIALAESSRSPWTPNGAVDTVCEEILLSMGRTEEAYRRYGLHADRGTYIATFRSVVRKYPDKTAGEILADLVKASPGEEGKWFAAAKEAGFLEEALALASQSPCDPKTLTRASRDLIERNPSFARRAGLLALHWLLQDYGYEITNLDVLAAFSATLKAAEKEGTGDETREQIGKMIAAAKSRFAAEIIVKELQRPAAPQSVRGISEWIGAFQWEAFHERRGDARQGRVMKHFNAYLAEHGNLRARITKASRFVMAPINELAPSHLRGFLEWSAREGFEPQVGKEWYPSTLAAFVQWLKDQGAIPEARRTELLSALSPDDLTLN
jgi:hypothetical protein